MQQKTQLDEDYSVKDMEDLILLIKQKKEVTDENLAKALGYNEKFISQTKSRGKVAGKFMNQLKGYLARLQNANDDSTSDSTEIKQIDLTRPIIQVVIDLTYIGKKNADSMDKMAATNQRNTDIIAALISAVIPNSKFAAQLAASLSGQHKDGEGIPVEAFLNSLKDIGLASKKQQDDKKKVGNK